MRRSFIALLIIIVIGGGAFAGWHFLIKVKPSSTSTSSSNSQNSNDYLVIREWGVRFKVPSGSENVSYHFNDTQNSVVLTTPQLTTLSSQEASCSEAKDSVVISRAKPGYDRFGSPWTENELAAIGTKVDDFYYYPEAIQACFNQSPSAVADNILSIKGSLLSGLKSIERVN